MIIKQRVKFTKDGHNYTLVISGRTTEELKGRVEKAVNREMHKGAELRQGGKNYDSLY